MKKILLTSAFIAISATSAFAAATISDTGTTSFGTPSVSIKPSKNVTLVYTPGADMTGTNGAVSYGITSWHASGTKTIASSSGDTKIFMFDATATGHPGAPAAGNTAAFGTGWTAM